MILFSSKAEHKANLKQFSLDDLITALVDKLKTETTLANEEVFRKLCVKVVKVIGYNLFTSRPMALALRSLGETLDDEEMVEPMAQRLITSYAKVRNK